MTFHKSLYSSKELHDFSLNHAFLLITFDLMWTQMMMQVAYTTAFDELSSMPSLLLDLALERYQLLAGSLKASSSIFKPFRVYRVKVSQFLRHTSPSYFYSRKSTHACFRHFPTISRCFILSSLMVYVYIFCRRRGSHSCSCDKRHSAAERGLLFWVESWHVRLGPSQPISSLARNDDAELKLFVDFVGL
jgi:hypothetical protein